MQVASDEQHIAVATRLWLQPGLTVAVAGCYRPVLLHLLSSALAQAEAQQAVPGRLAACMVAAVQTLEVASYLARQVVHPSCAAPEHVSELVRRRGLWRPGACRSANSLQHVSVTGQSRPPVNEQGAECTRVLAWPRSSRDSLCISIRISSLRHAYKHRSVRCLTQCAVRGLAAVCLQDCAVLSGAAGAALPAAGCPTTSRADTCCSRAPLEGYPARPAAAARATGCVGLLNPVRPLPSPGLRPSCSSLLHAASCCPISLQSAAVGADCKL